MKTQCPYCQKRFRVPDQYIGTPVKCVRCKESFVAAQFIREPITPKLSRRSGFFFGRAWFKTPKAFRAGFLATLGVLTALWFTWTFMGFSSRIKHGLSQSAFSKPAVALYDYEFEEDIDFEREPFCNLIWHAYVINRAGRPVKIDCFIELKNNDGSLQGLLGPISRTVPHTQHFPYDVSGSYPLSDGQYRQFSHEKSRVYIE